MLRDRAAAEAAEPEDATVTRTGQLYRIPRIRPAAATPPAKDWSRECITWPRYVDGSFSLQHWSGVSMLELTAEEHRALAIVSIKPQVKKNEFGTLLYDTGSCFMANVHEHGGMDGILTIQRSGENSAPTAMMVSSLM